MAAPAPTGPTLAGFLNFVRVNMNIRAQAIPDSSPYLAMSLAIALAVVNQDLQAAPVPQSDGAQVALNPIDGGATPVMTVYDFAVYNLAADNLVNFAPDQNGRCDFTDMRKQMKINDFVSGVVQSSSDEGTSVSMVVQEAAQQFTIANLQQMKTPWGRAYLALAQSYGPSTWGMS